MGCAQTLSPVAQILGENRLPQLTTKWNPIIPWPLSGVPLVNSPAGPAGAAPVD